MIQFDNVVFVGLRQMTFSPFNRGPKPFFVFAMHIDGVSDLLANAKATGAGRHLNHSFLCAGRLTFGVRIDGSYGRLFVWINLMRCFWQRHFEFGGFVTPR